MAEDDIKWLNINFEKIVDKFGGRYVLIINHKVYPVNEDNIVKVEKGLRAKYKRAPIGLPVPRPEDFIHVLIW